MKRIDEFGGLEPFCFFGFFPAHSYRMTAFVRSVGHIYDIRACEWRAWKKINSVSTLEKCSSGRDWRWVSIVTEFVAVVIVLLCSWSLLLFTAIIIFNFSITFEQLASNGKSRYALSITRINNKKKILNSYRAQPINNYTKEILITIKKTKIKFVSKRTHLKVSIGGVDGSSDVNNVRDVRSL